MGHIRLKTLPRTRKWRHVVGLIEGGAGTGDVAIATLDAAQSALIKADKDPSLSHTLWLLTQLPLAARSDNFSDELRKVGLSVSENPSLLEIVGALNEAVDKNSAIKKGRNDFGEMAQFSASEAIMSIIGKDSRSLFGETPDDVKRSFAKYATSAQFSVFTREFFSRLTNRYLTYFLSRELSNHVGGNSRFHNLDDQKEFSKALQHHCYQASRIIEEFAGGWYSKTRYQSGITTGKAAGFLHVALKKIRAELLKGS